MQNTTPWPAIALDLGVVLCLTALVLFNRLDWSHAAPILSAIVGGQLMLRTRPPPGGGQGGAGASQASLPPARPSQPGPLARLTLYANASVVLALVLVVVGVVLHRAHAHA